MKKIFYSMMALAIAAFTFTACEDVPEPYNNPYDRHGVPGEDDAPTDPAGTGTLEDPFNVAAAINYVQELGANTTSPNDVYVKGIITSITEAFGTQYGNATFVISDTEAGKNKFTFYRGLYLNNVKYTDTNALNIKEGDEVVICGKLVLYVGSSGAETPETSQGNAYVYSINGVGGGEKPAVKEVGSIDNPQTIAQAITAINALADGATTDEYYFVKGTISKINTTGDDIAKYKNINYIISDGGQDLTIYQGRNLNNTDFTKDGEINVGDEVIVYGQLQKYVKDGKVTPEVAKGNYIVKLNAGGTPDTPSGDVKKATIAEFNAASVSDDVWYELTGTVKNLKDGDQYGNFDLEDATGSVYVYGVLSEKGGAKKLFQELVAKYGIKEGSTITIHGTRGEYNGKIEVMNAYFVSIENSDTPDTPSGTGVDGSTIISIADFNAAAESNDVWYQLTGTVKNLKDGDQYGNFDLEDATGSVYVYGVLSEKGGAKKLFQELVTKYGIKNGSKLTIVGNRGSYNGKIEVMNAYFVSVENNDTPDTPSATGADGSTIISIADFNAAAESNDVWYQLTGTVKNLKDGDQYGNFDLEDATGSVYVYGVLSEKGGAKKLFQDLVTKYGIKNGSKLTIVGNRGSYNGKIEVTNAYFIKVD